MSQIAAAPWKLQGEGYMFFYKFTKAWVEQNGFVPDELTDKFDGFFGNIMLVNYQSSPVGPYRELLFIPGKFRVDTKKWYSITKIYVNSASSTMNGRANWGIPKETCDFRRNLVKKNFLGGDTERIELLDPQGEPFFDVTLSSRGIRFPISTSVVPIELIQFSQNKTFFTTPKGTGTGQIATVKSLTINSKYFPDVSKIRPLAVLKVTNFAMEFPAAKFEM